MTGMSLAAVYFLFTLRKTPIDKGDNEVVISLRETEMQETEKM
jgi:hypothetical protein